MKYLYIISFIVLVACSPKVTSSKFYNATNEFTPTTDQEQLICSILERAFVTDKDAQDYRSIADKKNIYILRTHYSKFSAPTKDDIQEYQFKDNEIPSKINDVHFHLKTREELQKIADSTSDFIYVTLAQIEIKGNIATIGIDTGWQPQSNPKKMYLSGGGYLAQYKKVDGKWVFNKRLYAWIS